MADTKNQKRDTYTIYDDEGIGTVQIADEVVGPEEDEGRHQHIKGDKGVGEGLLPLLVPESAHRATSTVISLVNPIVVLSKYIWVICRDSSRPSVYRAAPVRS